MTADNVPVGRNAARLARLGFRVVSALTEGLGPESTVVPDAESNKISAGPDYLPSSFIVQHLDLRVRLTLCLDASGPADLTEPRLLRSAHLLLRQWPETSAVALVADDDALSCLVIEPEEAAGALGVPSGEPIRSPDEGRALPAVDAVRRYIEAMIPVWPDLPTGGLRGDGSPTADIIDGSTREAAASVRGRGAQIKERLAALKGLSEEDVGWARQLASRVLAGGAEPGVSRAISNRSDTDL